jgi:hypothetical protein
MHAINSYETLVPMYQTTRCHIPADHNPSTAVRASNLIQVTSAWLGVISAHYCIPEGKLQFQQTIMHRIQDMNCANATRRTNIYAGDSE